MSANPNDEVIVRARKTVAEFEAFCANVAAKLSRVEKECINYKGAVRPGRMQAADMLKAQLGHSQARVEQAKAELQHAIDDYPRREQVRKDAAAMEAKAEAIAAERVKLEEQVRALRQQEIALKGDARARLFEATDTARGLEERKRKAESKERQHPVLHLAQDDDDARTDDQANDGHGATPMAATATQVPPWLAAGSAQ